MTSRGTKWNLHTGFAVLAVPANGLFYRDGRLQTGDGTPIVAEELIVFARRFDADKHAQQQEWKWTAGDSSGHKWLFPVVPVLVSERK